VGVVLF